MIEAKAQGRIGRKNGEEKKAKEKAPPRVSFTQIERKAGHLAKRKRCILGKRRTTGEQTDGANTDGNISVILRKMEKKKRSLARKKQNLETTVKFQRDSHKLLRTFRTSGSFQLYF